MTINKPNDSKFLLSTIAGLTGIRAQDLISRKAALFELVAGLGNLKIAETAQKYGASAVEKAGNISTGVVGAASDAIEKFVPTVVRDMVVGIKSNLNGATPKPQ